ncbi:hypothetical protein TrST_g12596 [Triparma strigata]|nr:hypothetical protein TrST_g12596 [Triparma strigata]
MTNKISPGSHPLIKEGLPVPSGGASAASEGLLPTDSDWPNYCLLIVLYTLQGIPMGLSATIPLLIQQRFATIAKAAATAAAATSTVTSPETVAALQSVDVSSGTLYNAQAMFALCSWPFSLKLLWAPLVDAIFSKVIGRRKSWLLPTQFIAGGLMYMGAGFVSDQVVVPASIANADADSIDVEHLIGLPFDIKGVTAFFFVLYLLLATQDIAVDGWALTMLKKENRGKGPVCNSIGQNIGTLLSYTGFLALNDETVSKSVRNYLHLPSFGSDGTRSLVSLETFLKICGFAMCAVTITVGLFKSEVEAPSLSTSGGDDDDAELDASEIGLRETYKRLYSVTKLPTVRMLVLVLLTYRFPTALSDNAKFLKALDYGLDKATVALLAPTIILPLGIFVPIFATRIWKGAPLKQFLFGYKMRVTVVAMMDVLMILCVKYYKDSHPGVLWATLVVSTALQTAASSLQFNAQMTFFASRVDRNIGGSYMTLLNTFANLGGTWPASPVLYMMGKFMNPAFDAYFPLQGILSVLGLGWLAAMSGKVNWLGGTKEPEWSTNSLLKRRSGSVRDLEGGSGGKRLSRRNRSMSRGRKQA